MFARDRREIIGVRTALTVGLPAAIRKWVTKRRLNLVMDFYYITSNWTEAMREKGVTC